ncbi:MAG: FAD-dependent oxidoreductase [Alphaproteobacteria bacterium]|nr:FAD-dependent oxidoreductase [Alphaproteobacteria bacterium]MBL7096249.1 FAD-dependent oxidoreductase [Alphaproteobacteria bacterium]
MRFSRRHVLGAAAALAAAPLLARAGAGPDLDVAIVGGGVAGAYAAWRLRQEQPHLRVRLFEASGRIGGRLHSVAFPQAPHLVAEVGGMRYLEAHAHVFNVVKHLGLPSRGYPIDRDANRVMLRGRNFSQKEIHAGTARFPYKVPDKDQTPQADYFDRALAQVLPNIGKMKAGDWDKVRAGYSYRGKPLRDWKNRYLLLTGMTGEELALAEDSSGYNDWIEGETGLDEMDYAFRHDDESKPFVTIAGGYQRLPLALAQEAGKLGADSEINTRVASIVSTPGGYRLATRDAQGNQTDFTAANIILALPRRGIERIDNFPEARTNARFANLIRSVTPIPAAKALLLYKRPWWRDHGITEGRNITDMPARQFYCLGAETTRLPSEDTNGYGVLMAYCDTTNVAAWRKLVAKPDPSGFTALDGTSALAKEIHREAVLVIGKTDLQPLAARFQDWTADPYGGGWHYYALGHDGVADSEAMLHPMPGRPLYVVGEAYSRAQGWVEGALERTETMLRRHFGLHAPQWLKT